MAELIERSSEVDRCLRTWQLRLNDLAGEDSAENDGPEESDALRALRSDILRDAKKLQRRLHNLLA